MIQRLVGSEMCIRDRINTVTVSGDDGITLNGAIYTDGTAAAGTVTLNDAVTIDGDVTIDTDDSSTDGNIVFTASIDGKSGGSTDTLTLEGGTGTITLQPIGATNPLGSLTINSQTTGTAALSIPNIGSGTCLLYTSPSPRDAESSRMPSSA